MKRSFLLAIAALCLAAGLLGAQEPALEYEARLVVRDSPVFSVRLPWDKDLGNWAVLLTAPTKDFPLSVKSQGKTDVNIVPIANVQVFRQDRAGKAGFQEVSSFEKTPLTLTVWIAPSMDGFTTDKAKWHLYMYSKDAKGWIRLDNMKNPDVSATQVNWGPGDKYMQVTIYEWPAGDPPIGIGDGG